MKKVRFFLSGIFLFASLSFFAQPAIGIEGGPNYSFLRGNDNISELTDPLLGFTAGFAFQYHFSDLLSIRTGPSFERKGCSQTYTVPAYGPGGLNTTEEKLHVNFDYVTLPVLVRASFGDQFRFFVNAGPYVGYLLNQTSVDHTKKKYVNTDSYKKLDYGVSGGLGIAIPIGDQFDFNVEIRDNFGLADVNDTPVASNVMMHNCTSLLVGFTYILGN